MTLSKFKIIVRTIKDSAISDADKVLLISEFAELIEEKGPVYVPKSHMLGENPKR